LVFCKPGTTPLVIYLNNQWKEYLKKISSNTDVMNLTLEYLPNDDHDFGQYVWLESTYQDDSLSEVEGAESDSLDVYLSEMEEAESDDNTE
jgi:hypothetical protein